MQSADNIFQDNENFLNDNVAMFHMLCNMNEQQQYKFWDKKRKPSEGVNFDDLQINAI